jgi:hypothetical protein
MTTEVRTIFNFGRSATRDRYYQSDENAFGHQIIRIRLKPMKKKRSTSYATAQVMSAPQHMGDLIFP